MHHACTASPHRASKSPRNEPMFERLIINKRTRYVSSLIKNNLIAMKNYREFDRYFHRPFEF